MKLCFIIYSLGNGGAERVLTTLANYFIDEYEISIITFNDEKSFYRLDQRIKIIPLSSNKNSKNIFDAIKNNISTIIKLIKTIKKVNSDVVISFMTTSNILSILACKILNKPIIISERTNYDFLSSKIWKKIRKIVYPFCNHLVVQSSYDLEKYNFVKNVSIIENPLFIKDFSEQIERKNYFLAVGRLDKVKGFDMLIEAYSKLNTSWKLKIVGEGKERKALQDQIESLNLIDKVELLGRKNDIEEYYYKAGIFVLSSRMEGYPNALVEAMACGCPCISFDCKTGPSSIIKNNINGILIANENNEELSNAMNELFLNEEDRQKLSKKALEIRENLNIKKISEKWKFLFRRENIGK
ncbi:glycosyltransferase family 4 protein [Aliarcobacter butzleri]|uniref:glycosyltransferase family 4 protein n=1 Tax=Aliarcobacter butzleri TaxID=28197 RepID=UPI001EDADA54|nr:glycosyltransferase family 4 protein [Aliarcobacter butzleri]MCG3656768.1 glycosyltransferase family 4 protein [Aliarcobacter butzleri]MDK2051437.1 glycosyltransferase family 4 protein [Aliarcobacter butzleri]